MEPLLKMACVTGGIILLPLTLVILLYCIPLRLVLGIRVDDGTGSSTVTLSWAVFGIRFCYSPRDSRAEILCRRRILYAFAVTGPGDRPQEQPPEDKEAAPSVPVPVQPLERALRHLLIPVESLGSVIWREGRIDEIRVRATIGFDNPALTGTFYGGYWAARFLLETFRIFIEVEPVFDREVFSCDAEVFLSVRHPLRVLAAILRLLIHPAVREIALVFAMNRPAAGAAAA